MNASGKIRIGILGGSSQIARSLVPLLQDRYALSLYSRNPQKLERLTTQHSQVSSLPLEAFGASPVDLIINSIGCGDPAQLRQCGREILQVTEHYDKIALKQLDACALGYIYFSSVAVYGQSVQFPVNSNTQADTETLSFYGRAKLEAETRHKAHGGPIVDLRIFGYVSDQLDLESGFLLSKIFKAIKARTPFAPQGPDSARDYIGPPELASLVSHFAKYGISNERIDLVSREYTTRNRLLSLLQKNHGLEINWPAGADREGLPVHGKASHREHSLLSLITRNSEAVVSSAAATLLA